MADDAASLSDNPTDPRDVLREAAATNAACSLRWAARQGDPIDRACRARVVGLDEATFEVAVSTADGPALASLVGADHRALATIRRGATDLLFVSAVADVRPRDGGLAARLTVPDRLLFTARRGAFRVDLADADRVEVEAVVWRIDEGVPFRDRPRASQSLTCVPHDLSGGGTRLTLAPRHGPPVPIARGQRLRVDLVTAEKTMTFDGRVRDARPGPGGGTRCGVQFVPHLHDLTWRRDVESLHRLLAGLQQKAAKRRAAA